MEIGLKKYSENTQILQYIPFQSTTLFLDLTQDLDLSQTVTEPTRSNNILNFFFTNRPNSNSKIFLISGVCDQGAVFINNKLKIKYQKQPQRKIYLCNKVDAQKI